MTRKRPITPTEPPRQGGSYTIGKDGKIVVEEATIPPGDPRHEANQATAQVPPETPSKDA